MTDSTLFGEQPLLGGLFSTVWDEPAPGSFFPRPRGVDPELLQAIGFGQLGRSAEDLPYWTRPPGIHPYVDSRMQMFVPPPNTFYGMPVYKAPEEVRPRNPVPPWVGPDGLPHLDDKNPNYRQNVSPGWGL